MAKITMSVNLKNDGPNIMDIHYDNNANIMAVTYPNQHLNVIQFLAEPIKNVVDRLVDILHQDIELNMDWRE